MKYKEHRALNQIFYVQSAMDFQYIFGKYKLPPIIRVLLLMNFLSIIK
jgi:hypothetical protein